MRQQRAVIDIAYRVEPTVVDREDSAGVVDVEPTARRQSHCLQADVVGEGRPAGGEEYLVDHELGVVVQREDHREIGVRPAEFAD
jgi:hypothetical protein